MADWLTIEELARREGITIDGARKRAQRKQYEIKQSGRRKLYRIITDGAADEPEAEKHELSAQSAYLIAKSKKMQLDVERAELKLNREKMLLYDEVRKDEMSALRLFCAVLKESLMQILDKGQIAKLNGITEDALAECQKRWQELRAEQAERVKTDPALMDGYGEYCKKKHSEEKQAAQNDRKTNNSGD